MCRLLNGDFGRLGARRILSTYSRCAVEVSEVRSVGHQTTAATCSRVACIVGSRAVSAKCDVTRLVFTSGSEMT